MSNKAIGFKLVYLRLVMNFNQKRAELFQIKVMINSYYSISANQKSEYWNRYNELKSQIRTLESRKRKLVAVLTKLV